MFKPNKKIVFILLLCLVIVSIAYIVYKTGTKSQNTTPTEKFRQSLPVSNYFQGAGFKIVNNIKSSSFKFPQKLPYLQQTNAPAMSIEAAKKIASNLGLSGEPLVVTGIEKKTSLIWNGDKYSLVISQDSNNIQTTSNVSTRSLVANGPEAKALTDDEYSTLAKDFLASKIGTDPSNLHFFGFSYFKIQNGVETFVKGTKENFDIVQLNFYSGRSPLPIITTNPDEPQIYVQFLKDGTFTSFAANLGSGFQSSLNEYPLKNYDQFSKEIGNSIIVSLNDNNVNLPDLKSGSISNIKANSVSLVYLLANPKDSVMQPAFLVQGTADVLGSGTISLSMYLPAFEGFSQP